MPTWIASSGEWDDSANWSGGIPFNTGDIAGFSFTNNGGPNIVGIRESSVIRLGTLNVTLTGTAGLTIQGSALDSGTGSGLLIFDNGVSNAVLTINNSRTTGPLTISGANGLTMVLASSISISAASSNPQIIIDAPITGSGALIVGSNVDLSLSGANTFWGGLRVEASLVTASGDSALGTGTITIADGALTSQGIIDNSFNIEGNRGVSTISAQPGTTMTLTGTLSIFSDRGMFFGFHTNSGTVVAAFSAIADRPPAAAIYVQAGTLQVGNAYNAANLFSSWTFLWGLYGTIDTNGFATTFNGLSFSPGRSLVSTGGALDVLISRTEVAPFTPQPGGIVVGTQFADRYVINVSGNYDLSQMTFNYWSAGDLIQLNGTGLAETLTGSSKADEINGGGGNDVIIGFGGIDTLNGGDGNDRIEASYTNSGSALAGGTGIDTLATWGTANLWTPNFPFVPGSISGFEILELHGGIRLSSAQFASGFSANAVLTGSGTITVDMVAGSQQIIARLMTAQPAGYGASISFTINGSDGADIVKANLGTANSIFGNEGTDNLIGGNLADTINGGNGVDKIRGEGGADILTGGAGADVFKYRAVTDSGTDANADIITDFVSGTDRLNFAAIDTNPGLTGDQGFAFVGTGAFTGSGTASIRYVDTGNDIRVEADVNGDGVADMHVLLQGAGVVGTLTAVDFVL